MCESRTESPLGCTEGPPFSQTYPRTGSLTSPEGHLCKQNFCGAREDIGVYNAGLLGSIQLRQASAAGEANVTLGLLDSSPRTRRGVRRDTVLEQGRLGFMSPGS